jgi:dCTP deaminase
MPDPLPLTPGVLAKDQLGQLIDAGCISTNTFDPPKTDASAIDLRVASKAWRLKLGERPTTRELGKIQAQSEEIGPADNGYFEFQRGNIYLVQLDHYLKLPPNVSGRATGKSSVGRLDVITRLITSETREYDLVTAGYDGPLHLLLVPQTFTIHVAPGASLNQLRLFCGSHSSAVITRREMHDYGTRFWWVLRQGQDHDYENWDHPSVDATDDPLLFDLTVDLGDPRFPYIYRARKDVDDPIDVQLKEQLQPDLFFEKIAIDRQDRSVVLEQGSFYIMKSRERLHIPDDVAVEVIAISERIGDIRIHYAGFAHPGFGLGNRPTRRGTPLIFEVRATDMRTKLYDQSVLARIQLFRMSKATTPEKSEYDEQELKLSKVFADWPEEHS